MTPKFFRLAQLTDSMRSLEDLQRDLDDRTDALQHVQLDAAAANLDSELAKLTKQKDEVRPLLSPTGPGPL